MEILSESNNNSTTSTEFTFSRAELDISHTNLMNGGGNNDLTNTYSEESTLSVNTFNQNGGGLFCTDEFNDILLEAFCDGRPDIVCYLLCKTKKLPKDIVKKDKSGKNILHHMSIFASHGNMVLHITRLVRKIAKSSLKKALKMQDEIGNTPLHYAGALGFNNLIKLFIDNGADPKIKNKDGVYIEEDDVEEITTIIASEDCNESNRLEALNDYNTFAETLSIISRDEDDSKNDIKNDIKNINKKSNYVFTPTEAYDTEHFMKELERTFTRMDPGTTRQSAQNQNNDSFQTVETEEIINQIINKAKVVEQKDIVDTQNVQNNRVSENTDVLVDNILNRVSVKQMNGGFKNNNDNNVINSESILTEIY
jgi:ankyrin repeat protein